MKYQSSIGFMIRNNIFGTVTSDLEANLPTRLMLTDLLEITGYTITHLPDGQTLDHQFLSQWYCEDIIMYLMDEIASFHKRTLLPISLNSLTEKYSYLHPSILNDGAMDADMRLRSFISLFTYDFFATNENVRIHQGKELQFLNTCEFTPLLEKTGKAILNSRRPSTPEDTELLLELIDNEMFEDYLFGAGHKELNAHLNHYRINNDMETSMHYVDEVIRVVAVFAGVAPSLKDKFRIPSFSRSQRRLLVNIINSFKVNEFDFAVHAAIWKRLFHALHISEFTKILSPALLDIVNKTRNDQLESFDSAMQYALDIEAKDKILELSAIEPGKTSAYLLRVPTDIRIQVFDKIKGRLSTKVMFSIYGELKRRLDGAPRIILPTAKSPCLVVDESAPSGDMMDGILLTNLQLVLTMRFGLEEGKKVFIEPHLFNLVIPTGESNKNRSNVNFTRGSKYIVGFGETFGATVGWTGSDDVDLSAVFVKEDFDPDTRAVLNWDTTDKCIRMTKGEGVFAQHSGDVRSAPNGASEFVCVDANATLNEGFRYVVITATNYDGKTFDRLEDAYVGLGGLTQTPEGVSVGVNVRIDVNQPARNLVLAIIDLKQNELTWLDVPVPDDAFGSSWAAESLDMDDVKTLYSLHRSRPTLGMLAELIAGDNEVTGNPRDADVFFGHNGTQALDVDTNYNLEDMETFNSFFGN